MSDIIDVLSRHYSQDCDESTRLNTRDGQVERFITMEYVHRAVSECCRATGNDFLDIIEIGSGSGVYAIELASDGHRVVASDLLEKHVAQIKDKTKALGLTGRLLASVDDVRDLSRYEDQSFDIVLCLGPLYHLFTDDDIVKAIVESIRICRVGGFVFFAYLPQDSIVLSYFLRKNKFSEYFGDSFDENFTPSVKLEEIFRGFYIDEFNDLMGRFNKIEHRHSVSADGMSHQMREHVVALDEEGFEIWKQYCLFTCERKDLQGFCNHMLWIGQRIS